MAGTKKKGARVAPPAGARERILAAALKLFAERGFDATATKAIAAEAEVPGGLVFYYFESKEALLEEIFKSRNLIDVIEETVDSLADEPPSRGLKVAGTRLFQWLRDHEDLARIFFKEMTSHRSVADRLRELRRRSIARVASYLDRAVQRGALDRTNTKLMAQAFVSSILLAAIFDLETNPDSYVRDLVAILVGDRRRRSA
ncbi:TetR/AcrR family transcriptional regulator [bacterium]|nr:MAG: TetR/AcrR family transcriptional regulator [bacterium]